MQCIDDTVAFMKRRVVDLGGCCCSGIKVELDDSPVSKPFEDYANLYLETSSPRIHTNVNRWDICVALGDGQFKQVSFKNNAPTMNGGFHVDCITIQIINYLAEIMNLKPNDIKSHLWLFVNAHVDDVALARENLTICELSPEFLKQIEELIFSRKSKEPNFSGIDVTDAKLANTVYSQYCTLVIVEGKSAGKFPSHGLSLIGEQTYGVFRLQGLLMNVRDVNECKRSNC